MFKFQTSLPKHPELQQMIVNSLSDLEGCLSAQAGTPTNAPRNALGSLREMGEYIAKQYLIVYGYPSLPTQKDRLNTLEADRRFPQNRDFRKTLRNLQYWGNIAIHESVRLQGNPFEAPSLAVQLDKIVLPQFLRDIPAELRDTGSRSGGAQSGGSRSGGSHAPHAPTSLQELQQAFEKEIDRLSHQRSIWQGCVMSSFDKEIALLSGGQLSSISGVMAALQTAVDQSRSQQPDWLKNAMPQCHQAVLRKSSVTVDDVLDIFCQQVDALTDRKFDQVMQDYKKEIPNLRK